MKKTQFCFIPLLLCCLSAHVMAGSLVQSIGSAGDFVFQTVATQRSPTCTLEAGPTYAIILAACKNFDTDCSDDNNWVNMNVNQGGSIELQGNMSYHFTLVNIKALSDKYHNQRSNPGYPNRIQIRQLYCSGADLAVLSNNGMYSASCSSSGCTATSGPIEITFPA